MGHFWTEWNRLRRNGTFAFRIIRNASTFPSLPGIYPRKIHSYRVYCHTISIFSLLKHFIPLSSGLLLSFPKAVEMQIMKYNWIFLLAFVFALPSQGSAQDRHFTMYDMSPLNLNPALAGAFYGSFRLGGIYRSQWFKGFEGNTYSTPAFFGDAPVYRGFRKQDWLGAGINFFQDNAGVGNITTSGILGALSYHFPLDKKQNHILTAAMQFGNVTRKIGDVDKLRFENDITGTGPDESINLSTEGESFNDWGAGILSAIFSQ